MQFVISLSNSKVLKEQRCEKEAALRAAQVQGPSTHLQDAGEGLLNDPSIAPQARVSIPRRFPTSVVGHDDVHPPITPATPSPMTLVPPMHGGVSCALDLQAGSNPSLLQHSTNRPSQGKRTPLERTYELRSKNLPQGYNLRSRLSMQPTPRLRGTYGRAAGAYMREVYGSK